MKQDVLTIQPMMLIDIARAMQKKTASKIYVSCEDVSCPQQQRMIVLHKQNFFGLCGLTWGKIIKITQRSGCKSSLLSVFEMETRSASRSLLATL